VTAADLDGASGFDLVVMAGNVVPLLAPGTVGRAIASLAALLRPGGVLVAGFGLDAAHLPPRCPVTPIEEYDEACRAARLSLQARYSTWDGAPFEKSEGYAVSVHVLGPDGWAEGARSRESAGRMSFDRMSIDG
jgi:hypothetical protein